MFSACGFVWRRCCASFHTSPPQRQRFQQHDCCLPGTKMESVKYWNKVSAISHGCSVDFFPLEFSLQNFTTQPLGEATRWWRHIQFFIFTLKMSDLWKHIAAIQINQEYSFMKYWVGSRWQEISQYFVNLSWLYMILLAFLHNSL